MSPLIPGIVSSIGSLAAASVSGGVLTSDATYYYRTFLASGTFTVLNSPVTADVLVVAGGGGGGGTGWIYAGGGGAGGLILRNNFTIGAGTYAVNVGNGGGPDTNGDNSSFAGLVAIGGGRGSNGYGASGASGGSGGGSSATSVPGGAGTAGQGNMGGYGSSSGSAGNSGAGGGGGAGAPGYNLDGNAYTNEPSNGGVGLQLNIGGTLQWYAEGGKGSGYYDRGGSINGIGGAVASGYSPNGASNTGSGGAGSKSSGVGATGGAGSGGSGIVIVRYLKTVVAA